MFFKSKKFQYLTLFIICLSFVVHATKDNEHEEKPAWKKKKITDYSDADMERLLDQWNV